MGVLGSFGSNDTIELQSVQVVCCCWVISMAYISFSEAWILVAVAYWKQARGCFWDMVKGWSGGGFHF